MSDVQDGVSRGDVSESEQSFLERYHCSLPRQSETLGAEPRRQWSQERVGRKNQNLMNDKILFGVK